MIAVSELNKNFKYEVMNEPGGEKLTRCFSCGACNASCIIRQVNNEYNPMRIIRMIMWGMKEKVLSSDFIWLCADCHACRERCPQGVFINDIMTALRNIAVREGYIHPFYKSHFTMLFDHGSLCSMDRFAQRRREKRGLPRISYNVLNARKLLNMTRTYHYGR